MSGDTAYMPEPGADPDEIDIKLEIATFEFKLSVPSGFDYSIPNLTEIKNLYVSPYFVRISQRLTRELGDKFEISVVRIEQGSLSIEGTVKAAIKVATRLSTNALAAGVLSSALTMGATYAIDKNNKELLYQDTIQKIELILKEEVNNLRFCPNPLEVSKSPLYSPKLKKYEMIEYTFCPSSHDRVVHQIEKTISNYHGKIGKI